jgi:hypothetical protein
MKCSAFDRILDDTAGKNGPVAQTSAETHIQTCALCRARVDELVAPGESLARLIANIEPMTVGSCPGIEDLACWCADDALQPEEARSISLHVSACEACAFSSAQLRLELGRGLGLPHGTVLQARDRATGNSPAVSSAPVVAQVVGTLILAVATATILIPRFDRLNWPREPQAVQGREQSLLDVDQWPLQASFEFRLRGRQETHSLTFPHYPGVQLSRDYEYAVHLSTRRTGWLLLFLKGPDNRLSLLLPTGAPSNPILRLEAGQTARFPSESVWEPISASSGRGELYAVYLDNVTMAETLVSESRRAGASGHKAETLAAKLDQMVVAGDCTSLDRPCVLTFEWEVF